MNSEFEIINISSFDGQTVWKDRDNALFEVGNFLGGGAAGNVYECEHIDSHEHYALKILNPIGYKILSSALLRKCNVLVKGKVLNDNDKSGGVLKPENIWWLLSSSNKQYIAGYFSERYNSLKELSLNQCIQLWGTEPAGVTLDDNDSSEGGVDLTSLAGAHKTYVPNLPPKFVDFIRRRNRIFREIKNMRKISKHKNVILLESVLELIQESKCTIFLVMELANGGELFDRIKLDCGAREDTANAFFQQLLLGVKHCHDQGVCHRDLKPENLLLQDNSVETVLKIADFGFSARFAMSFTEESANKDNFAPSSYDDPNVGGAGGQGTTLGPSTPSSSFLDESPLRVLKSVVGSPFYVAPEVMQAHGYDGCKADVWSLGVILYAMLAGNLPFSQELSICKRFRHFCKWVREETPKIHSFLENVDAIEFPAWLFPARFSNRAKGLIVSMLHPDPDRRISVHEAMLFPLCLNATPATTAAAATATPVAVAVVDSASQMLVDQVVNVKLESAAVTALTVAEVMPATVGIAVMTSELSLAGNNIEMEVADDDTDMAYSRVESNEDPQMFAMEEDEVVVDVRASNSSSSSNSHAQMGAHAVAKKLSYDQPPVKVQVPSSIVHYSTDSSASKGSLSIPHMPPMAKHAAGPLEDLMIMNSDPTSDDEGQMFDSPISGGNSSNGSGGRSGDEYSPRQRNSNGAHNNAQPPSFNDLVKRSTRFITAVPASEVLDKIETILENVKFQRTVTPIGFIGKVELNWDRFCLDVWGLETHGPALCSIYIYQIPNINANNGLTTSAGASFGEGQSTFLVEFVRGQLEIFAFKRFYQWVRQSLCELVKRDYALKFFDQASSPVLTGMYFPKK